MLMLISHFPNLREERWETVLPWPLDVSHVSVTNTYRPVLVIRQF